MKVRVLKDRFSGVEWRTEPEVLHLGGVGAAGVDKLEFELPEEWDGLAVTLHIEQEGGAPAQPELLGEDRTVKVDQRFTAARQGAWMLMASDGEGLRELTRPGRYICYRTLENGDGTGADGPGPMTLRYQYLQRLLELEERARLAAQRADIYRQQTADRCSAREKALLLSALTKMWYSDGSAWDLQEQLAQRWNSPAPERAGPVAVEKLKTDPTEVQLRVGESCALSAEVTPREADQTVEWMAEPEGIVALSGSVMTAVKGGRATLTAIAGDKLAQRPVRAIAVALDRLTLDRQAVTLKAGETVFLTATLTPAESTVAAVNWWTDNAALAVMKDSETPAKDGRASNTLIALKEGSCTLTASAGGQSAVCSVAVEKVTSGGGDVPEAGVYAVSNRLTGMSTSQTNIVAQGGKPYTATLTLEAGYRLISLQVTMGGEDVTATAWNAGTGEIRIDNVTGNIIITGVAKLPMLKELEVGSVVKVAEGKATKVGAEFIVAAQDYEERYNGKGRTLLIRKEGIPGKKWNTTWGTYDGSEMDNWLNGTYRQENLFFLSTALAETEFEYTPGYSGNSDGSYSGSHTVTTMKRTVFLPSCYEFGLESYGYTSANSARYYHLEGKTFEKAKETALALLAADAAKEESTNPYMTCSIWLRTPVLNDYGGGLTGSALRQYLYKGAETIYRYKDVEPTPEERLKWGGELVNEPETLRGSFPYRCYSHPAFTLPGNAVFDMDGDLVEVREE